MILNSKTVSKYFDTNKMDSSTVYFINDITGRIHINKIQNYQSAYLKMYQIRSSVLIILIKLDACLKSLG